MKNFMSCVVQTAARWFPFVTSRAVALAAVWFCIYLAAGSIFLAFNPPSRPAPAGAASDFWICGARVDICSTLSAPTWVCGGSGEFADPCIIKPRTYGAGSAAPTAAPVRWASLSTFQNLAFTDYREWNQKISALTDSSVTSPRWNAAALNFWHAKNEAAAAAWWGTGAVAWILILLSFPMPRDPRARDL